MSDLSDAIEHLAASIEDLVALGERDEVRQAVKALVKLQAKYAEELARPPLRVVR